MACRASVVFGRFNDVTLTIECHIPCWVTHIVYPDIVPICHAVRGNKVDNRYKPNRCHLVPSLGVRNIVLSRQSEAVASTMISEAGRTRQTDLAWSIVALTRDSSLKFDVAVAFVTDSVSLEES